MIAHRLAGPPASLRDRTSSSGCVVRASAPQKRVLGPRCASGNGINSSNSASTSKPEESSKPSSSKGPSPSPSLGKKDPADSLVIPAYASVDVPSALDLVYESSAALRAPGVAPVKTTGLRRAPLSGGVKTATQRFDLPNPSVAVRNLVEQAQFAHLCTVMSHMHHRRSGYPFGTLVDFASDGGGLPIFCLSPLAIHARNLIEDPRCSLVVQMPGWTGLANARVTIFGDVYQLPPDMQDAAREIFLTKQANEKRKERWVLSNFMFFRMHNVVDIYFVGGFGTVQWIDVGEYLTATPDTIATNGPQMTLRVLNETFASDLKKYLDPHLPLDDAAFISIDANGADVRVRYGSEFNVERIGFSRHVHNTEEAVAAVREVLHE